MCVCKEAHQGVKDLITLFINNDHRTSGLNYLQARAYCNVCFFRKNTFLTGGAGNVFFRGGVLIRDSTRKVG